MEASAKLARREYMRQWRARNKDKVKEHQERYWSKKANLVNSEDKKDTIIILERR